MAAPFEILIAPDAHQVLSRAPRPVRTALSRQLRTAAQLAALRGWEAQEPVDSFPLQLADYEGAYSLDLASRSLTLWRLVQRTPVP